MMTDYQQAKDRGTTENYQLANDKAATTNYQRWTTK
jgi:hypothetical protein